MNKTKNQSKAGWVSTVLASLTALASLSFYVLTLIHGTQGDQIDFIMSLFLLIDPFLALISLMVGLYGLSHDSQKQPAKIGIGISLTLLFIDLFLWWQFISFANKSFGGWTN